MDSTLTIVQKWIDDSQNKITVIERKNALNKSKDVLNVTDNSFLGLIINVTGGIVCGDIIRHFGGENKYSLTISSINNVVDGKPTVITNMLIIAIDVFGGIFAIDCGAFSKENLGKICYLPPDGYEWELMNIPHSAFLEWSIKGDLKSFYLPITERTKDVRISTPEFDKIWGFIPELWSNASLVSYDKEIECDKILRMRLEILSLLTK